MPDIKISQLAGVSSLNASDVFPISRSLGSGNWESYSITADNVLSSLASTRLLKVAKDGLRDADTIQDAISLAIALSPTESSPVAIQVFPGSYYENNPLNIPQWVTIYSEGGYFSAAVVANNNGNIFVSSGNSTINGFTILGLSTFSNVAYASTVAIDGDINNCIIIDCQTGILSNGGHITANFVEGYSYTKVFGRFLSSINGGYIKATSCMIMGVTTRPVYGYYVSGTGSELYLFSCMADNCVNGLYADNSGYIDSFSNHYEDCDNNIRVGPNSASRLKVMGCVMDDAVINDLFIESPLAIVAYTGHIDSSKFSIINGAIVNIVADDQNTDGGLITGKASLQGKVAIGTPGAITLGEDIQLNIGEGSAFVKDRQGNSIVEYWSYNATAPSGSRFTRFANNAGTQSIGANDAIYVGCKYPFPAIRLDVDVILTTTNYITAEYWNGISWVDLTAGLPGGGVAAYRRSDFATRGHNIFRNVETQFVECSSALFDNGDWEDANNILDQIPKWDAGDSFYAIRFRNNGALTSGMQFKNGMVKPHSFMVSTSGKKANFGLYRTSKSFYIDSRLFYPDPTNPPSYTNQQMSTNITFPDLPVFLKANAISQISTSFTIPSDIDTASPVTCFVDCSVVVTDPGKDIYTTMYIARVDAQNLPVIGAIPQNEIDQITTVTTNANSFVSIVQPIDISFYNPGDLFFLSVARKATDPDDTFSGDVIIGDIILNYKSKFV